MKYSKLFGKTIKEVSADIKLASHRLLYQAGFIRESTAGRYFFLPLGIRVRDKLMAIIEEEMNKAGAQKMITPVLHPMELWEETNRNNSVGFELMSIKDQRGAEFALGGTAEEMMVDVVRKFNISYRDLPFHIYQFSPKFRDELRARGGLLRVREFIMKDGYSFHTNEEDFKKEYKKMGDTYSTIFNRIGLNTIVIESDNGYIGGDYSHEYVVESPIGESRYLQTEDRSYAAHEEVAEFKREDINSADEELPLKIVEQPEWVKTMEDNMRHYNLPKSRFLKNVVYKEKKSGDIIIAVIRGDLEVDLTKLQHLVGGILEVATDEDLASISTKSGWVHSWGHDARYFGDISLKTVKNFIGGQKEQSTDSINVNYGRDFKCEKIGDIAVPPVGCKTKDGKELIERRGIEVGNIFQLGTHYSTRMARALFMDQDGKTKPYYMGCYGIGIGRTMATVAEVHHDDRGIIWPKAIAPYQVHLISIKGAESETDKLYDKMIEEEIEVLYDDRKERLGSKLKDADLIGTPLRIVVSSRTLESGTVEWKGRTDDETQLVKIEKVIERVKEFYKN